MANRRLFSKDVTESDAFTDMPLSTQALYFHMGMNADDDGFISSPKRIVRGIGASSDDFNLLVAKRFLIHFESGVVVVKHWNINNTIRRDRKKPTNYQDELSQLVLNENGSYSLAVPPAMMASANQLPTNCQPTDGQMVGLSKDKLSKDKSINTLSGKPDHSSLVSDVVEYLNERTGSSYKPTTKKTATLVRARAAEGFTLDDFKAVIDKKASDWAGDPKWSRYLRPETLFGTKFEGYLQEGKAVAADGGRYSKYR